MSDIRHDKVNLTQKIRNARLPRPATRVLYYSICVVVLVACQAKPALHDDTLVQSRDQAASVTISVNSVIPWSQMSAALQPNFTLSSADALAQVAPLMAQLQTQSSVGTSVGANFSVQSSPTGATGGASGSPTSAAPTVSSQIPALPGTTQTSIDPVLKYQTARALYEAVQLMNREVQEAALRHCFVPYLVELKLAVLPYRRHLPYDIHTRLSFFRQPYSKASPAKPTSVSSGQLLSTTPTQCLQDGRDLPQVIPLLVTDDIERATASRAAQATVQSEIELKYAGVGVSGGAGANRALQSLQSISAQDINTRFTVARQTYNTLYVRVGAAIEGSSDYGLVGQTYDIPVLLLVPRDAFDLSRKEDPRVQVISYTEFRDARTGEILPDRPNASAWATVDHEIAAVLVRLRDAPSLQAWEQAAPDEKEDVAVALFNAVQSSNSKEFVDALCAHKIFRGKNFACKTKLGIGWANVEVWAKSLWPQISALRSDSPFQGAFIQLRWPEPIKIDNQDATGFDENNDLTVYLGGVSGSDTSGMTARVVISGSKGAEPYTLLATGINFDALAHTLSLKFPSPSKWGIATTHATLSLNWETCSAEEVCPDQPTVAKAIEVAILTAKPASGNAGATSPQ